MRPDQGADSGPRPVVLYVHRRRPAPPEREPTGRKGGQHRGGDVPPHFAISYVAVAMNYRHGWE